MGGGIRNCNTFIMDAKQGIKERDQRRCRFGDFKEGS